MFHYQFNVTGTVNVIFFFLHIFSEIMATDLGDINAPHVQTPSSARDTSKRTRPHATCDVCGKYFKDRSNMNRHKRIHNNSRRFECLVCGQLFIQKTHLDAHMLRHTLEKEFSCGLCDATFNRRMTLVTHLRTHTQEKGFQCPYCSESFNHKISLTTHIDNHLDIRRFLCQICGRGFNKKANLKRHMNVHSRDSYGRDFNNDNGSQPIIACTDENASGFNDDDGKRLDIVNDTDDTYGRGLNHEADSQTMVVGATCSNKVADCFYNDNNIQAMIPGSRDTEGQEVDKSTENHTVKIELDENNGVVLLSKTQNS